MKIEDILQENMGVDATLRMLYGLLTYQKIATDLIEVLPDTPATNRVLHEIIDASKDIEDRSIQWIAEVKEDPQKLIEALITAFNL
jgi:hypothetical protein